MVKDIFDTHITYLKGVGPKKAKLLVEELDIHTFNDLLNYFPFRYVDKSKFYKVKDITSDAVWFQLKGTITSVSSVGDKRTRYITAKFQDETGSIDLVWFRGLKWIKSQFVSGKEYVVFGKPSVFKNHFNFVHPEVEEYEKVQQDISLNRLEGIYNSSEKLKNAGLGSKGFSRIIKQLLNQTSNQIRESLPTYLVNHYHLLDKKQALINIHLPENPKIIEKARHRLKFEELLLVHLQILQQKQHLKQKIRGHIFGKVGNYLNEFYADHLPFELTNAQKRVIKEIRADFKSGRQMNRLLQGDVGSGKTLVALMNMLIAIDNGFQVCLMAPTEILAKQHYATLTNMLGNMDITIELLTGSTTQKERTVIHENLQNGSLQILIGTHAVIEDTVQFQNLGFVVIDEQHRFGVEQRARLWRKNDMPPHILVMTATPIPRTLAMTVYGNLDVSVIDELPPGRKTVETLHYWESKRLRVYGFMRQQIKEGRQIYVVFPLISESEKLDLRNLIEGFETIVKEFPPPEYQVSVVHGKLKSKEKDFEMKRFVDGVTDIMVSTTVIEVGVDVSNASVMIIENAERFGLSQLHQLRGRVGRGAEQSYCILMSGNKLSNEGRKRLEVMVATNDGFKIAEADLQLRGPGDLQGTQQSGVLDFKIANLASDGELVAKTNKIAAHILNKDDSLGLPENKLLKEQLELIRKGSQNWGRIS
ncbi:MAG: ATP-dependent DNA helicase RecG [Bacteroidales bacterium]|jgi:ATP-dependent DNA helicase RecG|nr:ATP-dependent DNA helicase RecG [Bacteroidales bacterium]